MSGDFPRDQEWYPRECALCTREAALACDDFDCRARKLGEDYEEDTEAGRAHGVTPAAAAGVPLQPPGGQP
jgi:hypothetical protein